MSNTVKVLVVSTLIFLIVVVFIAKKKNKNGSPADNPSVNISAALPKLIDLGADKCIPCKAMKPILEDLAANHKTAFETVFIDVWQNPDQGEKYGIELIPTQIFFDSQGKELFRHEGFFSKEDILVKWNELGVKLD